MRAALAGGQSVNRGGGEFGRTCLGEAVGKGHMEVVTELLQQEDSDLRLGSRFKNTALHYACVYGRVGMFRQLASEP